jgi:hypothetical protein
MVDEMGRASSTNGGEDRNACRFVVVKPKGKRPLGRPRYRWVENNNMDLGEIELGGLVQDRDP